jgi:hypothetical protein
MLATKENGVLVHTDVTLCFVVLQSQHISCIPERDSVPVNMWTLIVGNKKPSFTSGLFCKDNEQQDRRNI